MTRLPFGFITFDWQASSTADSLNSDVVVILPPVAKVNGVWQYFIDNGRAIKPDAGQFSGSGLHGRKDSAPRLRSV